jgi:hypothetical protein
VHEPRPISCGCRKFCNRANLSARELTKDDIEAAKAMYVRGGPYHDLLRCRTSFEETLNHTRLLQFRRDAEP